MNNVNNVFIRLTWSEMFLFSVASLKNDEINQRQISSEPCCAHAKSAFQGQHDPNDFRAELNRFFLIHLSENALRTEWEAFNILEVGRPM